MIRNLINTLFIVMLALVAVPGLAQDTPPPPPKGIDINVKGGARRVLMPIAVPDALEPDGATKGVASKVNDILRRDLEFSGFFKVLPNDSFFFDPSKEGMTPADINFQNWFNVGAQALIKSSVKTSGEGVVLDLRLYQVDKGTPVKLKWTPSGKKDDVEANVHAFVNAVIEYYTGTPGIFGTRIAYVARQKGGIKHIYTMGVDGTGASKVSKHNAINILPTWGPGGAIYYTSYADQNPDLWVVSGGKVSKLSSQRGQNSGAAYCGGKLAVTLSMGGENADIYLIDPKAGTIVKRLTDHWAIDTSPTWNADCSKIAFVSSRSGGPQIYVMNGDGGDQRRLTFQGTYNTSPDWSPKGDVIAFTARDERARFDIFTVALDGTMERLTQDQGNNQDPSFSPDGRYIVFFIGPRREGGSRVVDDLRW
ncbi:MAG: DPP IV N-terminal domain-containing protein [bacterium]